MNKQEIQKKLTELSNIFLDDYGNHRELEIKDLMNATFIFSSTILDFVYTKNKDEMTFEGQEKLIETVGKAIRQLIIASTDVDPKEHSEEMFK